jgi:phosphotransferase system  glucose/maltose/N-acetylglucosamine-specific IIC component
MLKKILTGSALALTPTLVLAQANAFSILGVISNIMRIVIPLLVTAALLIFIYGVVKYVIAKNADDTKEARNIIVRGLIGLFVILSIWGLVGVIQSTFGIGAGGDIDSNNIPGVNFQ